MNNCLLLLQLLQKLGPESPSSADLLSYRKFSNGLPVRILFEWV